jgi:hypothetical protein
MYGGLFVNKEKLFYQCFSDKLRDFLKEKSIYYILKCKHYETLKPMWIYLYDSGGKLDNALQEWSDGSPN